MVGTHRGPLCNSFSAMARGSTFTFIFATFVLWVTLCLPGNISTVVFLFSIEAGNSNLTMEEQMRENSGRCYQDRKDYDRIIENFGFWTQGIGVLVFGIMGLIGNALAVVTLISIKANRSFNKILTALAVVDFLLVLVVVIEMSIFDKLVEREPKWFKRLVPKIFHPVRGILQTADTFLLVAVSIERYKAICRPITPKHPAYLYLIAVMFLSLSLEIPRFFELELDRQSNIWPSLLFENIEYIRINSFWNELLVSGILPTTTLTYVNISIYKKVNRSLQFEMTFTRRFPKLSFLRRAPKVVNESNLDSREDSKYGNDRLSKNQYQETHNIKSWNPNLAATVIRHSSQHIHPQSPRRNSSSNIAKKNNSLWDSWIFSQSVDTVHRDLCVVMNRGSNQRVHLNTDLILDSQSLYKIGSEVANSGMSKEPTDEPNLDQTLSKPKLQRKNAVYISRRKTCPKKTPESLDTGQPTTISRHNPRRNQDLWIRKRHGKSTAILIFIVVVFVVCHSFRMTIRIFEITFPESTILYSFYYCSQMGKYNVPVFMMFLTELNYFFLTLNCSVNFLIYCWVSQEFRQKMFELFCKLNT